MAEDGGVGLGQMQPVGEIDALKHVVGTPGAIVEEMVGAESPVHIVGIAEQEHAVVAAQTEQALLLLVGDGGEQRIPGSDNLGVGGWHSGDASHLTAELGGGGVAYLYVVKQVFGAVEAHVVADGVASDGIEGIDAALSVEVDEHAAQVEDYILNPC